MTEDGQMVSGCWKVERLIKAGHVLHSSIATERASVVRALERFLVRLFMAHDHATMRADIRQHTGLIAIVCPNKGFTQKGVKMWQRGDGGHELRTCTHELPGGSEGVALCFKVSLVRVEFGRESLGQSDVGVDQLLRHEQNASFYSLEPCVGGTLVLRIGGTSRNESP